MSFMFCDSGRCPNNNMHTESCEIRGNIVVRWGLTVTWSRVWQAPGIAPHLLRYTIVRDICLMAKPFLLQFSY